MSSLALALVACAQIAGLEPTESSRREVGSASTGQDPNEPVARAVGEKEKANTDSNAEDIDVTPMLDFVPTPAMQGASELTIEMWMRPQQLPPEGGRGGLADRNGSFGFFLQANGDVTCTPGTARASVDASSWRHVACVIGQGKTTIFVDGVPISESEAGPPASNDEPIVIGSNSPSGDPFVGELDSLRMYVRAKLADEIAAASALPDAGGK